MFVCHGGHFFTHRLCVILINKHLHHLLLFSFSIGWRLLVLFASLGEEVQVLAFSSFDRTPKEYGMLWVFHFFNVHLFSRVD